MWRIFSWTSVCGWCVRDWWRWCIVARYIDIGCWGSGSFLIGEKNVAMDFIVSKCFRLIYAAASDARSLCTHPLFYLLTFFPFYITTSQFFFFSDNLSKARLLPITQSHMVNPCLLTSVASVPSKQCTTSTITNFPATLSRGNPFHHCCTFNFKQIIKLDTCLLNLKRRNC